MAVQKVGCCGQRTETMKITIISPKNRSDDWIVDARPGDLYLFTNGVGRRGGILRLPAATSFITVTADQLWRQHPIAWPFKNGKIRSMRIVGQKVEFLIR